jgi:hypothetical protein
MSAAGSSGGGARAHAATAADAVAAVVQLDNAAVEAEELGRTARAVELRERTLAAAEASLPADSIVIVDLLHSLATFKLDAAREPVIARGVNADAATAQAFGSDERLLSLSRKALMLCDARFRAGTLFTPTPEEDAFFDARGVSAHLVGALIYLTHAAEVLAFWPPPRTRTEDEARLRAAHGALQACLEMERRGFMSGQPFRTGAPPHRRTRENARHITPFSVVGLCRRCAHGVLAAVLDARPGGVWQRLRNTCAIPAEEAEALRQLAERNREERLEASAEVAAFDEEALNYAAQQQQRAAADVARHGLRKCALPECAAKEPQPKAFKVCSRCRGACYCSVAHQQQDWRRHKREDGCAAAAAAAKP